MKQVAGVAMGWAIGWMIHWHAVTSRVPVQTAVNMSLLEFESVLVSAYTGSPAKANGAAVPAAEDGIEAAVA